jgi:hypothetical protein
MPSLVLQQREFLLLVELLAARLAEQVVTVTVVTVQLNFRAVAVAMVPYTVIKAVVVAQADLMVTVPTAAMDTTLQLIREVAVVVEPMEVLQAPQELVL